VVVNHDSGPLLERCVRSLLEDDSAGSVELVVVDNASTDGSLASLERAHPDVAVVRAPGNVGYAAGANLGSAVTRAPVVAVLNPDTVVPEGCAAAMLDALATAGVGAVGPRVTNPDGSDYPSARVLPGVVDAVGHGLLGFVWPENPFTRRYRQLDADPAAARDVDWVSGCAIWLRRDALDVVGGWDERYFMYVEDVDLCARLRGAGYRVRYEPAGHVQHVQGASTAHHPYRMIVEHHRSLWRFARGRLTGSRTALLPFAGAYLTVRVFLAVADHVVRTFLRARSGSSRSEDGAGSPEQGRPKTTG
jgi:N-acetylglucosaminyl-diphospho-decaprenol L-rhamnosyltransferase